MDIKKVVTKSGAVRWEVRSRTDGRGSKRLARRFEKRIDAENFYNDFKVRAKKVKASVPGMMNFEDTSFQEEANRWLEHGKIHFSASHYKRVDGILKELLPKYGRLPPNHFTLQFIDDLQQKLKAEGLANNTVNRKIEVVAAVLKYSAKKQRIPYHPCAGITKLPDDSDEMLFWQRSEAESFLGFMDRKYLDGNLKRWIYVVYLLTLNTAMRAGEVWGLKPLDLINGGETLFLKRQFDRVKKDFGPLKGKESRHVPCNSEVRAELLDLIQKSKIPLHETLFRNELGNPIDHDNFVKRQYDKDLAEWIKNENGKEIRFHDLRHTATTLMIGGGIDLKTVQEVCGHQDISTTMEYVHLLGENVRKMAQSFSIQPKSSEEKPRLSVVHG